LFISTKIDKKMNALRSIYHFIYIYMYIFVNIFLNTLYFIKIVRMILTIENILYIYIHFNFTFYITFEIQK